MTNTASKLLQRSERELLFQIHRDSGLTDYQSMANLQFSDIGLDHVDYDKVGNEDYGESSEEIYGEAYWVCLFRFYDLSGWLDPVPPKKRDSCHLRYQFSDFLLFL